MRIIYEEHVADNGEVLPHVLFWDFTRHIVESYISGKEPADWIPALDFLEEAFGVVDDYSRGVISASFLESLPYAGEPGAGIAGHLGPTLRSRLAELRRSANLLRVPSAHGSLFHSCGARSPTPDCDFQWFVDAPDSGDKVLAANTKTGKISAEEVIAVLFHHDTIDPDEQILSQVLGNG
jgi:hypothetical protein